MSNTAPSRANPVVVFPLGRWCPPQETSQPPPPPGCAANFPTTHELKNTRYLCGWYGGLSPVYKLPATVFRVTPKLSNHQCVNVCHYGYSWYLDRSKNQMWNLAGWGCQHVCPHQDPVWWVCHAVHEHWWPGKSHDTEPASREMANIVQWNEAWHVFMVTVLKNPAVNDHQRAQLSLDMIQYMQLINQLNDDNADWSFHDENFWLFKQYNEISFSSVDYDLKSRAVTRTNNMARWQPKYKKPQRPAQPKQNSLVVEAKGRLSLFLVPLGYCKLFFHHCHAMRVRARTFTCVPGATSGIQPSHATIQCWEVGNKIRCRPCFLLLWFHLGHAIRLHMGNPHSHLSATLSQTDRHSTTSKAPGAGSIINDSPDQRLWAAGRWCLPWWSVTRAWTGVLCLSSTLQKFTELLNECNIVKTEWLQHRLQWVLWKCICEKLNLCH